MVCCCFHWGFVAKAGSADPASLKNPFQKNMSTGKQQLLLQLLGYTSDCILEMGSPRTLQARNIFPVLFSLFKRGQLQLCKQPTSSTTGLKSRSELEYAPPNCKSLRNLKNRKWNKSHKQTAFQSLVKHWTFLPRTSDLYSISHRKSRFEGFLLRITFSFPMHIFSLHLKETFFRARKRRSCGSLQSSARSCCCSSCLKGGPFSHPLTLEAMRPGLRGCCCSPSSRDAAVAGWRQRSLRRMNLAPHLCPVTAHPYGR